VRPGSTSNASARRRRRRLGDEGDAIEPQHLQLGDEFGHPAVDGVAVGAQLHLGIGLAFRGLGQAGFDPGRRDLLVTDIEAAIGSDGQLQRLGRRVVGALPPLGRSRRRLAVMSGAVIMKMTSSTSMTSMSGVMLMSAIGLGLGLRSSRPKAMAGGPICGG
jgi:hypothetical protein